MAYFKCRRLDFPQGPMLIIHTAANVKTSVCRLGFLVGLASSPVTPAPT
jgi:hypothetical protein